MQRWVTSDLHINHKNIISYCQRPFASVEEMNLAIINKWNEVVAKDDIVYVLGDFFFGNKTDLKELLPLLNGRKILIMGNHDRLTKSAYLECGFEEVIKGGLLIDGNFILSHQPISGDLGKFFNIHGHKHKLPTETQFSPRHFDIGVDDHNFYPHKLDKVEKILYNGTRKNARFKQRTMREKIRRFLRVPFGMR